MSSVSTQLRSGLGLGFWGLLGGSWVVISRVISPLIGVIIIVTLLITPLITTHEPPSKLLQSIFIGIYKVFSRCWRFVHAICIVVYTRSSLRLQGYSTGLCFQFLAVGRACIWL